MLRPATHLASRIILAIIAFIVLAIAIVSQPPKWLSDFDQSFYLTIAYDLDRHGIFSNGIFDGTDSTRVAPLPGMFFGPGYPLLVFAAMKIDPRFAEAVRCSVESNHKLRDGATCEVYALPVHLIHALLLALGVLAIARAGELIFDSRPVFWLAGALATGSLLADADLFSFLMTESLTFSLYCLFAWAIVLAWKTSRARYAVLAGGLLGLLCLTRASFLVLLPVAAGLVVLNGWWLAGARRKSAWAHALVLVAAFAAVVGSWVARNAVSVGKPAISEEYGSVALIERFAYDDMTVREFVLAFPYCTPGIGDLAFDLVYGTDSMHRFVYHTPNSFFHVGRGRRDLLVQQHGRLDPVIGDIVRTEMRENWWRYLLTSVPLGWCGMWVGGMLSLVLLPLFVVASVRAVRRAEPLLLLYAAPAVVMLGLHAAVANHYTRYNLILIGPFAVAAAWIMSSWRPFARWRAPARAPERSRSPSGRAA